MTDSPNSTIELIDKTTVEIVDDENKETYDRDISKCYIITNPGLALLVIFWNGTILLLFGLVLSSHLNL